MEETKRAEALETLRLLLGILDGSQDGVLEFLLADAENLILGYCRICTLPEQLYTLLPALAADMYRAKGYGRADAPAPVTSVSEGGRSVSFGQSQPTDESILASYHQRLAPYVNKRGLVPSDIPGLCKCV